MNNIVLGVTGSIAAYKACDIVSLLTKNNVNVDVILTKNGSKFVNPITFQTLSKNLVNVDTFQEINAFDVNHISLAKKADIFLIAPATANIIAKLANGIADDMLSCTALATKSQIIIAPAMNTNMYENPATIENIEKLKKRGVIFIEPETGKLACNDIGKGKLANVEDIVEQALFYLQKIKIKENNENKCPFENINILVTAGSTIEDIDPVRYLTNRSTGKMGYEIAKVASIMGGNVTLISGNTNLKKPFGIKKFVSVRSASEMYEEVLKYFKDSKIIIKAAAVADYTPLIKYDNKIKKKDIKGEGSEVLKLKRTIDILEFLGKNKDKKILIGFAAETSNLDEFAKAKIKKKNLDMIILNDVSKKDRGFGTDTNVVKVFFKDESFIEIPKMSKENLSFEIFNIIKEKFKNEY